MYTYDISIRGRNTEDPILDIRVQSGGNAAFEALTAIARELTVAVDKIQKISFSQEQA